MKPIQKSTKARIQRTTIIEPPLSCPRRACGPAGRATAAAHEGQERHCTGRIHGGEPQQRRLTTGPADTDAQAGPVRAEGGQQGADGQLQRPARNPGDEPVGRRADGGQDDHRGSGTHHRRAEHTGGAAQGDHHDGHLEAFEGDALAGQHEAGPVEASGRQVAVVDVLLALTDRPPLGGDAQHSLAQPLQPEDEQQRADDQSDRWERDISITSMPAPREVAAPTVTFIAAPC
ncbi:MAG: hypothetical protein JWP62_357 [Blastococcus sp.]|jgi:hypothetical protein|nr:hypothetical protein [Blastococcus sp.]